MNLVNITDARQAGVPTADIRQLIADLTRAWEHSGAVPEHVKACVVVDNAIVRGVLAVLNWMHGDIRADNVGRCAEALRLAITDVARMGRLAPAGLRLEAWVAPERPARAKMR